MLPPHPHLRPSDLRNAGGSQNLPRLLSDASVHRFYNARAAIYQLALALGAQRRSTILLPAFHCPSVVEPVLRAGMRPAFYRVDRNMELDLDDLRARLHGDVAAVLFINYLGFPSRFEPLLSELRSRDMLAIEDCAHACVQVDPLELAGRRGDAAIYSFWKLVPSGVGGGLWLSEGARVGLPSLSRVPVRDSLVRGKHLFEELVTSLGDASLAAKAYAWVERTRIWAKSLGRSPIVSSIGSASPSVATETLPDENAREYFFDTRLANSRLPWMAEQIMARADLTSIVNARRRNYRMLASTLDQSSPVRIARPELRERISPLAFPVSIKNRSMHDVALRARGIPVWTFGNTLHRALFECADPRTLADASHLADTMLLIPVHQLLEETDMSAFADTINRYAAEKPACAWN